MTVLHRMTRTRRLCLTLAGTALPLLLALALPGAARATCGDYLHVGGDDAKAGPEPAKPAPARPCDGPGCSRREPAPLAPAPAPPTSPGQEWLSALSHPFDPPAPEAGWAETPPAARPLHAPSGIFDPPR